MNITPDGKRYLALAAHHPVPRPFNLRFLIPALCGHNGSRWQWCSRLSVLTLAPLAWVYTGSPWMAACVALPGVWFNWRHPVLVDAPGMVLALAAACVLPASWPAAVILALLAGCVRETAPVWSAIYAWNPLLLVGLIPVGIRLFAKTGPDPCGMDAALAHPFNLKTHRWSDPFVMVTPWGPLVAAALATTPQLLASIAAGYGQLLAATDEARLYQWAFPVVALATVQALPPEWLPLVAVGLLVNPWKGSGL